MAPASIYASCVALARKDSLRVPDGAGILILGASGSGKSDLALRLIERGAVLVADDRCELFVRESALWCRAPVSIAGLLEIRGVGIVELPFRDATPLALAVELVASDAVPRLPAADFYSPPAELNLPHAPRPPLLRLAAFESSTPPKIMAAAAAFAHALFRENCKPS